MKDFPSKRDLWLVLVLWFAVGVALWHVFMVPAPGVVATIVSKSVMALTAALIL